ncbi:hypothetical protein ACSZN2_19855 [Aeromonas hydrophila]|uniref:hypothetical protein n=1 Tax=Aeromonas hydrophila TaxID=644 RepID=UPI003EC70362
MNDAEKQRILSAAIQTKLLRALASFARNTVVPGLSNVGAREQLLLDVKSSAMSKVDDSHLLSELVCVIADLIEEKQTLPSVLESAGYVSGVAQSAFDQGTSVGQKISRTTQAKKGGMAKAQILDQLKAKAVELANQGNYQSRKNASEEIADVIVEMSQRTRAPLASSNAPRTIAGWLKEGGWHPKSKQG